MQLQINLTVETKEDNAVKKAKAKKRAVTPEPTWEEVWQKIAGMKNSDSDKMKLREVKQAIDNGELGKRVESHKKFTKAHAIRLYKTLLDSRREQYIKDTVANIPKNYHLITDGVEFQNMIDLLDCETEIGLDTETTGVDHEDRIVGLSMSLPIADYHCYIPVRHVEVVTEYPSDGTGEPVQHERLRTDQLDAESVLNALKPYMESSQLGKILHNAKFDSHMMYKEGIDLQGITIDTMIAMHVLNENEPTYALKALASKYGKHFGFEDKSWDYVTLFGKNGFQATPFDIGTYYACKDTHLCIKFAEWIRGFFKEQPDLGMAYQIENDVLPIVINMERRGIEVDLAFADKYRLELEEKVSGLEAEIKAELGVENINSNQQLLKALIEQKILPKDATSVDKKILKSVKSKSKAVEKLLEYRDSNKLLTTYFIPLPTMVRPDTKRLHGNFNQVGTVTGRFSSSYPNYLNIPPEAREMFIAGEGREFVGIDFSQQEVRYMAHISGDDGLMQPYRDDEDIYSSLASQIFDKPIEECGDGSKYRKQMKVGVLAVLYGISAHQLKDTLECMEAEAQKFLDDFKDRYPSMKQFMEDSKNLAYSQGFVPIAGGRKRRFPLARKLKNSTDWKDRAMKGTIERQSVNSRVQGGSATMTKIALEQLQDYIDSIPYECYIVLSIYDEIVFDVPKDMPVEHINEFAYIMANALPMDIPMCCDIQPMDKWGIASREGWRINGWDRK